MQKFIIFLHTPFQPPPPKKHKQDRFTTCFKNLWDKYLGFFSRFNPSAHTGTRHWPAQHTTSQHTRSHISGLAPIPTPFLCPTNVLFFVAHSFSKSGPISILHPLCIRVSNSRKRQSVKTKMLTHFSTFEFVNGWSETEFSQQIAFLFFSLSFHLISWNFCKN